MNPKYICAISAIVAVVSLLVLASFVYPSEASYTQSSEFWYWSTLQNVTYKVVSGTWGIIPSSSTEESRQLQTLDGGIILIPVYAVNPNPTLVVKHYKGGDGFLKIFTDGGVGSKEIANVSLYYDGNIYNAITRISTNLSKGYSTLNITIGANGSYNDGNIQAMWLE